MKCEVYWFIVLSNWFLLRHFILLLENLYTMNWCGRQAGAGSTLSPLEIYIFITYLKTTPPPERPIYSILNHHNTINAFGYYVFIYKTTRGLVNK